MGRGGAGGAGRDRGALVVNGTVDIHMQFFLSALDLVDFNCILLPTLVAMYYVHNTVHISVHMRIRPQH